MIKRIRYVKTNSGIEVAGPFLAGTKVVNVYLNQNKYVISTGLIGDDTTVLAEGTGYTKADLMRKVKSSLKVLGVVMADEVRKRVTL